jgi:hypothetical protein
VNRFCQFAGLPPQERWLLLRAAGLVAAVRLALFLLPFPLVRRAVARAGESSHPQLANIRPRRLSWAVQASARRIPKATCLTQALALQALLAQAGRHGDLHIGVAHDTSRVFEAHAWVEYEGEILIGDNGELARYAPIASFPNSPVSRVLKETI